MKRIFFVIMGLLLLTLVFLLVMNLLGYNFNKEFISNINFDKKECIEREYPTYRGHSGIAGCIFWSRHDYLEIKERWRESFKRDDLYCSQKYKSKKLNTEYLPLFHPDGEYGDPKCTYDAYQNEKRSENWNYLTSKEKDGFYESCVNTICPRPSMFK